MFDIGGDILLIQFYSNEIVLIKNIWKQKAIPNNTDQ